MRVGKRENRLTACRGVRRLGAEVTFRAASVFSALSVPAQPRPNPLTDCVPNFTAMTGNHKSKTITRRRALAVTGGTVAAGGLAVAGYRSAFADEATTTTEATATAEATSTSDACMTLMSSVTEGPYYLERPGPEGHHRRQERCPADAAPHGRGRHRRLHPGPRRGRGDLALRRLGLLLGLHHREPRRFGARRERGRLDRRRRHLPPWLPDRERERGRQVRDHLPRLVHPAHLPHPREGAHGRREGGRHVRGRQGQPHRPVLLRRRDRPGDLHARAVLPAQRQLHHPRQRHGLRRWRRLQRPAHPQAREEGRPGSRLQGLPHPRHRPRRREHRRRQRRWRRGRYAPSGEPPTDAPTDGATASESAS